MDEKMIILYNNSDNNSWNFKINNYTAIKYSGSIAFMKFIFQNSNKTEHVIELSFPELLEEYIDNFRSYEKDFMYKFISLSERIYRSLLETIIKAIGCGLPRVGSDINNYKIISNIIALEIMCCNLDLFKSACSLNDIKNARIILDIVRKSALNKEEEE